jgi:beta-glucosidase/6-phospho-beta-glucosidase/beta-galactosidase/glycosyltransferase involved in cell wall biosynthesis
MHVRNNEPFRRNGRPSTTRIPASARSLRGDAGSFAWGVGIECSTLPHLGVDQFAWTQHDREWLEDFKRAADSGARYLRYSVPWHWVEPERGRYSWTLADRRIEAIQELGLEPMLDVMHFGTPLWLRQAVGDVEFPEALENLTARIVERYRSQVRTWCPINEPLVCALFAGDFGFWPPYARSWRGYMPVLSRIAQATSRSIRAIRRAHPEATVLLCDTAETYQTKFEQLHSEVALRNNRRFVLMDLVTGRIDHHHPLFDWLTAYGFSELDLDWLRQNPQTPDALGLDYYPHGDWQLDMDNGRLRQRRADVPAGLKGVARDYYDRYGLPMIVTETSIEGRPINREVWLDQLLEDARALRERGIPLNGLVWWPLIDHVDWDGAMTHRVGKVHEVGLYKLVRQRDGKLGRLETQLLDRFRQYANSGNRQVGELPFLAEPLRRSDEESGMPLLCGVESCRFGLSGKTPTADPAPGLAAESAISTSTAYAAATQELEGNGQSSNGSLPKASKYGIVVFSHLRWGFVWQRPQQYLSRFAKQHPVLFVEEPIFDLADDSEPKLELHRVMPEVTAAVVHASPGWQRDPRLPAILRNLTQKAVREVNGDRGYFDVPLLWYYSPMEASWSLGHFPNRGVVYDCMDELSQFRGAPAALTNAEARLLRHADVVFCGGYELGEKKARQHSNVHTFGCGVEYHHFAQAQNRDLPVPADIDFISRPILGFFGVVDERLDYQLLGELAQRRPDWSVCIVGPVVKIDPAHLPHAPNLFWLGGRDYQLLPDYCRAFDVCLMPFAMNSATEFINPTKGLEYMATGRPVVSTPIRDVVRQWSDIVHIANNDADSLIRAIEAALAEGPESERVCRGLQLAQKNSWEANARQMQQLIANALNDEARPSRKPIEPASEQELSYVYQHTPGS